MFCAELAPDAKAIRRLQRQMERQRRAANPEHYDEKGRIKKQGHQRAQVGSAPQEPAWAQSASGSEAWQHHHHRKDFLQGMAEAVWQECGTAITWDVCGTVETHRCKHGRHPGGAFLRARRR
ncbi:hypothetical protein [Ktedonobacter racemifer]|uniref:hypothetical protein n=1 Tax=Ktedonobacter racemifer TaxID=363277 RepID=UPI00058F249D